MKLKMPKSDREVQEDPFLLLGFGINSYFDVMKDLMIMFTAITFFLLPLFVIYSDNEQVPFKDKPLYALNKYSLGNMGGSYTNCENKGLAFGTLDMRCSTGRFDISKAQYGVMAKAIKTKYYCTE